MRDPSGTFLQVRSVSSSVATPTHGFTPPTCPEIPETGPKKLARAPCWEMASGCVYAPATCVAIPGLRSEGVYPGVGAFDMPAEALPVVGSRADFLTQNSVFPLLPRTQLGEYSSCSNAVYGLGGVTA